ncbi:MAG: 5-guanidino-2-oxopentanoate decarboxylase [Salaquimonas sp.]
MKNTKTCGEAIVALLEKYDVDTVFGIPGVHTLELYRGLVGSSVRHILPRHEQGAGFMADGYARATGKPGVCFLITGPGVTNAATPIGQAYSDSIPMLVISSVNESRKLGKGLGELHEMPDQQKLMSACTAFSARADHPHEFPALLARAFDVFNSARPRPVHIEVPIDIFEKEVDEVWEPHNPLAKPLACEEQIAQAISWLENAQAPAMILGGGALGSEASVNTISDKLSAPVVMSVAGAGLLPSSNPLSLGSTLVAKSTHEVITKSDVVLVVGSELASTDTWGISFDFTGKMIRVDIDPKQFENGYQADLNIHGDGVDALARIASALNYVVDEKRLAARSAEIADALVRFYDNLNPDEKIRQQVFDTILGALPEETLITADMTQIGYTGHSVFKTETAGRFFNPTGYGTLGYALPAAIGAQLGMPEKPVVAFVGDGGLQYTIQEMATAAEEGLPIVVILWNNDLLLQIHEGFVDHGIEPIAVFPKNPDFEMLARAYGWHTAQTSDLSNLSEITASALKKAQQDKKPVMIEILVKELK